MKVGCAAIFQNQELLKRLPIESSIYSDEATAINLAMSINLNLSSNQTPNQSSKVYRTKIYQLLSSQDY